MFPGNFSGKKSSGSREIPGREFPGGISTYKSGTKVACRPRLAMALTRPAIRHLHTWCVIYYCLVMKHCCFVAKQNLFKTFPFSECCHEATCVGLSAFLLSNETSVFRQDRTCSKNYPFCERGNRYNSEINYLQYEFAKVLFCYQHVSYTFEF